ncbi:MAG: hypothetical protein EZS28_050501, partial [Streblomastix strix]
MTESKKRTVSDQNDDVQQSVKEERLFNDDYDEAAELFGPDSSFIADRMDKFEKYSDNLYQLLQPNNEYNEKNESSAEIETDGDSDQYVGNQYDLDDAFINDESNEDYVPVNERQRKNINQDESKSEQEEDEKV